MDKAAHSVRVESCPRDYRGAPINVRIHVAEKSVVHIKSGWSRHTIKLLDSLVGGFCMTVMIVVPLVSLVMSMGLAASNDSAALFAVPIALVYSLATLWLMMRLSKATRETLSILGQDRPRPPRMRQAQVFDLVSLAERNKHIAKVRVIHRATGDDIEVSTDDGDRMQVFEGLTPDESASVVEVLEA
jgi:hypothetical protein